MTKNCMTNLIAVLGALLWCGAAVAETAKMDYTKMSPEALAEYLIAEGQGFKMDQKTQEGGTVRDRHVQDEIQKICSGGGRENLTAEQTAKVLSLAKASVVDA